MEQPAAGESEDRKTVREAMKKIMFNDHYQLTQAVLEGRKTMTRRIIPDEFFSLTWDTRDDTLVYENDFGDFIDIRSSIYCRYHVGEVVAVAQSYERIYEELWPIDKYEASHYAAISEKPGWTNKMFVKAELMLHRIRITGIRVERLQGISDEDCINEGIQKNFEERRYGYDIYTYSFREEDFAITPKGAFRGLINAVSGRGTWERNPWCFAYEFELLR